MPHHAVSTRLLGQRVRCFLFVLQEHGMRFQDSSKRERERRKRRRKMERRRTISVRIVTVYRKVGEAAVSIETYKKH